MKEISIEEKARRYDEAIKEASAAYEDEDMRLKATLESIFPELKESENKGMTLNEAISHCEEVALSCAKSNRKCALEHVQLMQWLKELRALRKLVKPEYLQEIRGLQKTWGKEWEEYFNRELCYDLSGPFRDRYK